jgi:acetylornithine deacetylase/succinyl-diaminopimelate desuccinylase family protein
MQKVMIESVLSKLDDNYTTRLLDDMIRINSVVGQEGEFAEYLRAELDSLGLKCNMDEVEPGRPNVYARLKGEGQGKRLHLNGHTDTVPVVEGWGTDPFTPVRVDEKMYGLGSCDMKAGIACIINALRAIIESGFSFNGELSFSGVIDEEAYGLGAKALLKTDFANVDSIILAEPYPGNETKPIPLGITGKILYDIHVHGKAAHGFRPHLGVNAIEDASKIIANLERLNFRSHPDFGVGNYSTLKIEGGYEVYSVVVPANCRFEVNRLLVPGETIETATADMEALVKSLALDAKVDVKIKPPKYEAYMMERNDPILQVFDGVYRDVMGVEPLYEYTSGITDANIFAGEGGIPCLHLGPQRGGAHQKDEFVHLAWLPPISKMYALIATRYLTDC